MSSVAQITIRVNPFNPLSTACTAVCCEEKSASNYEIMVRFLDRYSAVAKGLGWKVEVSGDTKNRHYTYTVYILRTVKREWGRLARFTIGRVCLT